MVLYARDMLLIIGTIRLPSSNLDAARPIMKRMVESSRAEEGCVEYGYAEDLFEPGLIHVKERWTEQTALDRHFASTHISEWRAAWQKLEISDRNLLVYDVGEPRQT
ncbi:MAG: putative quinol monooxygenase [Candidatus Brevundimonas colombiensis]|uniref:Quinol monooxygenase n=1 Tax=Candidatus Brevundimonas colombiensis TaxID=3121376 RepID=A0AAJ5X0G4_9CAUL|nr:putative quinol monooxygenase [Brevundimonas sp.]WEK38942.1 MAG: putative quinol monooxygenase [Brevundimonas sp.]